MPNFEELFNCIHDNDITSLHYDITYTNDIFVTVDEIESVIGHLDKNKSCDLDGVYAEHLMYCSRLQTSITVTGYAQVYHFCSWFPTLFYVISCA